jgi:hypothetical protein
VLFGRYAPNLVENFFSECNKKVLKKHPYTSWRLSIILLAGTYQHPIIPDHGRRWYGDGT